MMENKSWGDRKDGRLVRDVDELHAFTPLLMPKRADNEAFIRETIDITNMLEYLEKKNDTADGFNYTMFHVIIAAMVRSVALRPHMNRFVKGGRLYQRDNITAAFVIKKQFSDESHEAMAFQTFDEDTTMDDVYRQIRDEVTSLRGEQRVDNTTGMMNMLTRLPRLILRLLIFVLNILDYYGRVPDSLIKEDPNQASIFLSNLGSIKLNAAYHHLANWGTNSIFVTVGERKLSPVYDDKGNVTMVPTIALGLTIDERIADGYYYAQTIKLVKHLLQNPDLLDGRAGAGAAFLEENNEKNRQEAKGQIGLEGQNAMA